MGSENDSGKSPRGCLTPALVAGIRCKLRMTQGQLARLLGVHSLTISKWERGLLRPTPYQNTILRAAFVATEREPDIGALILELLDGAGVGRALFCMLRAAYELRPSEKHRMRRILRARPRQRSSAPN